MPVFDYRKEIYAAKTDTDIKNIFMRLFGIASHEIDEMEISNSVEGILSRITDPGLRKLIDDDLKKELEKIRDIYAREARREVLKNPEKSELMPSDKACETRVYIPGRQQAEEARYEVLEITDIQASHLPELGFERNPQYGLENERQYHKEVASRDKVLNNAATLNPDFLLRDSVDANNGAPIIDKFNNVLGGNSRVMSIKLAYKKNGERINAYREELKKRAIFS